MIILNFKLVHLFQIGPKLTRKYQMSYFVLLSQCSAVNVPFNKFSKYEVQGLMPRRGSDETHIRRDPHKKLNTSYLTDSYIVFTLKMESATKSIIFGLKMMVKSGLEKIFMKFLHAQAIFC